MGVDGASETRWLCRWNGLLMVLALSYGILKIPHLRTFLADSPDAFVGWGRRRSGKLASTMSRLTGLPLRLVEDGFLRSIGRADPLLSLLVDDLGVYYDCRRPSRLEVEIGQERSVEELQRAERVAELWRAHHLSKYNYAKEFGGVLPEPFVLLVDQVENDLSVAYGGGAKASFLAMVDAARHEAGDRAIVIKTHPDIYTRGKRGYLGLDQFDGDDRVTVIVQDCHAASLVERCDAVYTVTSQLGFEGLIWGKVVRCFGMPFYAGWGLTQDEQRVLARRGDASLEQLVFAALIACARYVDPSNGDSWEIEDAIAHVAQRRPALNQVASQMRPV